MGALRADLARWTEYAGTSSARHWLGLLTMQSTWAVAEYRFARWARTAPLPGPARVAARALSFVLHRLVEVLTGISISGDARIGPGLYIGHFGGIVVGPDVVMGRRCNITQGVTIGAAGSGASAGSPVIGDEVHVMPGAKIYGKITIGDWTRIGANAVVTKDLPSGVLAMGVPATDVRPDTSRVRA